MEQTQLWIRSKWHTVLKNLLNKKRIWSATSPPTICGTTLWTSTVSWTSGAPLSNIRSKWPTENSRRWPSEQNKDATVTTRTWTRQLISIRWLSRLLNKRLRKTRRCLWGVLRRETLLTASISSSKFNRNASMAKRPSKWSTISTKRKRTNGKWILFKSSRS